MTRFHPGMNPRLKRVCVCLMSFAALGLMVFTTPDAKERPSSKDGGTMFWPGENLSWCQAGARRTPPTTTHTHIESCLILTA